MDESSELRGLKSLEDRRLMLATGTEEKAGSGFFPLAPRLAKRLLREQAQGVFRTNGKQEYAFEHSLVRKDLVAPCISRAGASPRIFVFPAH